MLANFKRHTINLGFSLITGVIVFIVVWLMFRSHAVWTVRTAFWWWFATWTPRLAGLLATILTFWSFNAFCKRSSSAAQGISAR